MESAVAGSGRSDWSADPHGVEGCAGKALLDLERMTERSRRCTYRLSWPAAQSTNLSFFAGAACAHQSIARVVLGAMRGTSYDAHDWLEARITRRDRFSRLPQRPIMSSGTASPSHVLSL
jgi:hypothetical protein